MQYLAILKHQKLYDVFWNSNETESPIFDLAILFPRSLAPGPLPPQLHFQSHCGTCVSSSPCLKCTLPSSATPVLPILQGSELTGPPLCNLHWMALSHTAVSLPWSPDIVPHWKVPFGASLYVSHSRVSSFQWDPTCTIGGSIVYTEHLIGAPWNFWWFPEEPWTDQALEENFNRPRSCLKCIVENQQPVFLIKETLQLFFENILSFKWDYKFWENSWSGCFVPLVLSAVVACLREGLWPPHSCY